MEGNCSNMLVGSEKRMNDDAKPALSVKIECPRHERWNALLIHTEADLRAAHAVGQEVNDMKVCAD